MAKRFALVAVFLTVFSVNGQAADCLKYQPASVELSGIVVPTMFYGPPNFGEDPKHDRKDIAAVLVLDKKICVTGTDDNEKNVSRMQMVFQEPPYGKQWNGKHVRVSGSLYHSDNALQYTNVLIWVVGVQPLAGAVK